jgi:hypothetical protein
MYGTPVREQGAVDIRGRICMVLLLENRVLWI